MDGLVSGMTARATPALWWCAMIAGGWALTALGSLANAAEKAPSPPALPPGSNRVYEAELGEISTENYERAVEHLLAAFERATNRRFSPGAHARAALKVYSDAGPGLSTPKDLVRGVVKALERRGFKRENLMIVGLNASRLRASGFIPPLSVGGDAFEGVPVIALESGRYYDSAWFYDSPLPSTRIDAPGRDSENPDAGAAVTESERRSLLPVPLMFDVDFWINLPGCSDHPIIGVNGALVNATLWNASNTQRFFRSPANGPAAAAEIAAIPELRATWACTIISLERFQFIGGPIFNSLYTLSEPRVWLSDNPVMLDALMRQRINQGREAAGFRELEDDLRLLSYGQQVGLGSGDRTLVEWVPVRMDRAP
jgi:hypothetical protein